MAPPVARLVPIGSGLRLSDVREGVAPSGSGPFNFFEPLAPGGRAGVLSCRGPFVSEFIISRAKDRYVAEAIEKKKREEPVRGTGV